MKLIINKLNEILDYIKDSSNKGYMDINEVCHYSSLSKSTIRRNVTDGKLTANYKTGKLLFKVDDVDSWLNG